MDSIAKYAAKAEGNATGRAANTTGNIDKERMICINGNALCRKLVF